MEIEITNFHLAQSEQKICELPLLMHLQMQLQAHAGAFKYYSLKTVLKGLKYQQKKPFENNYRHNAFKHHKVPLGFINWFCIL